MRAMIFLWAILSGSVALASVNESFVTVPDGEAVFTNYRPAAEGRPTLVLLNGLTYSLSDWNQFTEALSRLDPGVGILRFDFTGMGKTLLKGQLPVSYPITVDHQVEQTLQLLRFFGIAKASFVGLSYGGAIAAAYAAQHLETVDQVIMMAPFTEPLKTMDQTIRNEITAARVANPFNPASDDELYDFFLRPFIYSTYPALEPSVLENPYKLEAIFRMVQGIRKYRPATDARKFAAASAHLLVAGDDQYIQREIEDRFWQSIPTEARASRIVISGSEHKIPEAVPAFAAAWVIEILRARPELSRGLTFEGDPKSFRAISHDVEIELPRK